MSKMLDLEPDLLVTVGDLSYADGWAERWDIFGMMMEPLMSSRYHLAVVGNHEIIQNNGVDFIHRYPMPFRQSGAPGPYMFAYESGLLQLFLAQKVSHRLARELRPDREGFTAVELCGREADGGGP